MNFTPESDGLISMERPNKDQTALLQARHLYNDARIEKVIDGGGFTVGSDDVLIRVNRYAWGLFEATILKAFKANEYLREWSPTLVSEDVECPECKGVGGFPYVGEEYKKQLADWNDGMKEDDYFYLKDGEPLAKFCSICHGSGIVLKKQPEAS